MTADEVFSACVPAIFKLYAYDYKNNILGIGSGVVLSARGDAVTCGHLVNGVYRLVAEMYDGTKREVTIYTLTRTRTSRISVSSAARCRTSVLPPRSRKATRSTRSVTRAAAPQRSRPAR